MELRRRLCLLFLLLLTCTVFWARSVSAQETNFDNGPIGMTGEAVKCDELTDEQKKEVAEAAYGYLQKADDQLRKMATDVAQHIEAKDGVCHYLHETGWLGLSEETADESGSEFSFSSAAKTGAEKIDELLSKTPTAVSLVDDMIDGEVTAGGETVDLKQITDWNFAKLYSKAIGVSGGVQKVTDWAKNAEVGSYMNVDEKDSKLICSRVQCGVHDEDANECNVIYKHDANSYVCFDLGDSSVSKDCGRFFGTQEANGKCYKYETQSLGGMGASTRKVEVPCSTSVDMSKSCWKAQAFVFTSAEDIQSKITESAQTQKCLEVLKNLSDTRGSSEKEGSFVWNRIQAKHRMAMLSDKEKDCSCTKEEDGTITAHCISETKDDENKRDCRTIGEYQAEIADTCPTCDLLATIAAAAQKISKGAFDALANDLTALVSVAFLIYLAYITLITIASPEAQKISKYLSSILIQGFKVALTILILQHPTVLYQDFLGPVLDGSVDLSMSLLSTPAGTSAAQGGKYASKFDSSNQYLSAKTLQNMVGVADNMNREAAMMPAIGRALICHSFEPIGPLQTIAGWFVPFPYQFSMFIEGGIVYIFGYMILLSLIAYLLDCMVSLGLVCAIMAFCVACWPFKLTSNYTTIGWNMFLNVFFNFVMLGVVVTVIVNLSTQSVTGGIPETEFVAMVNGDNVPALAEQISIGSMHMLIILVCAMICLKLPKEISRLAHKFSGGAQISIGAELAGAAAQVATKAAIGNGLQKGKDGKRHLGGAAGLLWKGISKGVGSAAEHTGLKGAASAAGKAIKSKAQSAVGRIGLGPKARMASRGRDAGANKNTSTDSQFKQDR